MNCHFHQEVAREWMVHRTSRHAAKTREAILLILGARYFRHKSEICRGDIPAQAPGSTREQAVSLPLRS